MKKTTRVLYLDIITMEEPGLRMERVEGMLHALKGMGAIDVREEEYEELKHHINFPVQLEQRPGFVRVMVNGPVCKLCEDTGMFYVESFEHVCHCKAGQDLQKEMDEFGPGDEIVFDDDPEEEDQGDLITFEIDKDEM